MGLGWLAGVGALALALARLGRLLASEGSGDSWPLILAAAAILGGVITYAMSAARLPAGLAIALHLIGSLLVLARVTAPDTLTGGILPTGLTLPEATNELKVALELIRYGAAPVVPLAGLIGILSVIFWWLGAAVVWGSTKRKVAVAVLPGLIFYLQLAVLDRIHPGLGWPAGFGVVVALGLLAGTGRRRRQGLTRGKDGTVKPPYGIAMRIGVGAVMVMTAVGATRSFAASIPESGWISWRNTTGFGGGFLGGVSVNLFTSLQQDIVNQSSEPVFLARVSQAAPPNRDLYWKLITLDVFDGDHWLPGSLAIGSPGPNDPWEADDFSFQGPTIRVEQVIAIGSLRQNYLPILHSPVALSSEVSLLEDSYRVREDGSVKFDARTFQGLTYRVTSDIPVPDLAALASRGGKLSPIFQSAVDSGAINLVASKQGGGTAPSRVIALYLDLPDSLPPDIGDLAQEVAKNGSTGFERAILLEAFFRASGRFVYDARASTGHSSLDLSEWLNNSESRNYRTGYCEQFATAMAVMARTLGIPSRLVIGFAPGELSNQADGSELIIVRQRNTHAWVEVWIGGQGWVRLDPTPRADGINRSTTASLGFDPTLFVPAPGQLGAAAGAGSGGGPDAFDRFLEEGADPTAGLPGPSPNALPGWLRTAAAGIAVMGLVPVLKKIRRQLRLRRLRRGDIAAAWIEITDQLRDLGHPVEDYLTPLEIAGDLDPMLFPLAQRVTTAVYGERAVTGAEEAFRSAERHLRNRHPSRERILGRLALRSLRPRS